MNFVNLDDVMPFVPIVGTGHSVRRILATEYESDYELKEDVAEMVLTSYVSFVVSYEVLGDRMFTPTKVHAMRAIFNSIPAVALGTLVTAAAAAVAIPYERKVNQPIRKGTKGTFFGPYASGFGSVV